MLKDDIPDTYLICGNLKCGLLRLRALLEEVLTEIRYTPKVIAIIEQKMRISRQFVSILLI